MKRRLLALLLATSLTAPALALEKPKAGDDPNIKVVDYNPLQRVEIVGMLDRSTTITYGPDETIARVEFGDQSSPSWEGPADKQNAAPLKNILPLWPVRVGRTNLQVITTRPDGSQRVYQYELEADANNPDPKQANKADYTYGLVYRYPDDEKAARARLWQAKQAQQAQQTARDRLKLDFWYGESTYAYKARGKLEARAIEPAHVRDNGRATGFQFPGNMRVPSIAVGHCDNKTERMAQTVARNDWLISYQLAPVWCLRSGDLALEVEAVGKPANPAGTDAGTGTGTPDVQRLVVPAAAR